MLSLLNCSLNEKMRKKEVTFEDDSLNQGGGTTARLREKLSRRLEKRRNMKVNQVIIDHHTSEFRKQFKTK